VSYLFQFSDFSISTVFLGSLFFSASSSHSSDLGILDLLIGTGNRGLARFSHAGILVKTETIKILGELTASPWQRFCRLQRMTAKLARRHGQPKGVYRFASYQECAEWTSRSIKS